MKKLFFATTAIALISAGPTFAADMISTAPETPAPVVAAPAFTWTGGYAGIRGGGVWVHGDFDFGGLTDSDDFNGGLIGGFVGYNWQLPNNVVVGLEGDLSYNWDKNSYSALGLTADVGTDVSGSVRGRLGYAFDRALVYATGGWGYTRGFVKIAGDKETKSFNGWTVGAGVDYAVTNNIFARVEYRYTDYSDQDIDLGLASPINVDLDQNEVTVGVGLKF